MNVVEAWRTPFASEKLMGTNASGRFSGCRIATVYHGYAIATNNLACLNDNLRIEGKQQRTKALKAGWEGTGDKTRAGYTQDFVPKMAAAMFPGLPLPRNFNRTDFGEVWDQLDEGKVISISLRLSAVDGGPARRFTSADHQVLLVDKRINPGNGVIEGLVIDPMAPKGGDLSPPKLNAYRGHWVPRADIRKAARAIEDGLVIAELFPIGGWTKQALEQLIADGS